MKTFAVLATLAALALLSVCAWQLTMIDWRLAHPKACVLDERLDEMRVERLMAAADIRASSGR